MSRHFDVTENFIEKVYGFLGIYAVVTFVRRVMEIYFRVVVFRYAAHLGCVFKERYELLFVVGRGA